MTLLRRSPFKAGNRVARPDYAAALVSSEARSLHVGVYDKPAALVVTPKDSPLRSEAYRRLVAMLDCSHCARHGPSQAAHADEGKGLALKADDRTCYPLCADQPGRKGCHSFIGASGLFTRDQRRTLEAQYAAKTRAAILAAGMWPKGLPLWEDKDDERSCQTLEATPLRE